MKKVLLLSLLITFISCKVTKEQRKENLKTAARTIGALGTVVIIHKASTNLADGCKQCK